MTLPCVLHGLRQAKRTRFLRTDGPTPCSVLIASASPDSCPIIAKLIVLSRGDRAMILLTASSLTWRQPAVHTSEWQRWRGQRASADRGGKQCPSCYIRTTQVEPGQHRPAYLPEQVDKIISYPGRHGARAVSCSGLDGGGLDGGGGMLCCGGGSNTHQAPQPASEICRR